MTKHADLLREVRKKEDQTTSSTEQSKGVPHSAEYIDSITGPAIINLFIHFARFFGHFRLPYLFFADLFIKAFVNPIKIAQLWQSNKPLHVKIMVTVIRLSTYLLLAGVISTAIKPVAAFLAKVLPTTVAASTAPFGFTLVFSIFTFLSALDLKNKVKDLNDHPWKATEIEKLKRNNKVVKTVGMTISTASIWPMFKFGLVPVLIAGKVVGLASNPIGWGIATALAVTLIGIGTYKLYARQKLRKLQRKKAHTLVDNAIDPEATLKIDLNDIKNQAKLELTHNFDQMLTDKNIQLEKNSPEYTKKLQDYLYKGSRWERVKAVFGGGSPLGRAQSKAINEAIQKQFDERADEISGYTHNQSALNTKINSIIDYKYRIFGFGIKPLTPDAKLKIAREEYLKYGTSRYDLVPNNTLEAEKAKFNDSEKGQKLMALKEHTEQLSSDYGRDYYQKTKKVHELARDPEFNPYTLLLGLDTAFNASQREIKRAYKAKLSKKEDKDIQNNIQYAYDCLSDKKHRERFDITFAAYHNIKLYGIIRGNKPNNSPITDLQILKETYNVTKNTLKAIPTNKTDLQELEWAYNLLKDPANLARYEKQQEIKIAYDAKLKKKRLYNNEDNSDHMSTYETLLSLKSDSAPNNNSNLANKAALNEAYWKKTTESYTRAGKEQNEKRKNIKGTTDPQRIAGRLVREGGARILKNRP